VKLLLDTHVLLWALLEPQKLSPELRIALEDSDNTLVVSAATAWEIATKWRLGKLRHAQAVVEHYAIALNRLAAVELPISGAVARQAGLWPAARTRHQRAGRSCHSDYDTRGNVPWDFPKPRNP
jgi:PIN domain nuclease of toxin-antitoxin system